MPSTSGLVFVLLVFVVGRDTVLGVTAGRELRCGRRLVSGLFSRARLPLGYTFVTTVPRGACRLNVTEIVPNENYIALKMSNRSFIMNGDFAVSAPGNYEAAGTRFLYTRTAGRDAVFAYGPIHHPVDIMILYTQPSPNIKYSYFTDSQPDDGNVESVTRPDIPDGLSPHGPKHQRRQPSYDTFTTAANIPKYPEGTSLSKEVNSDEDGEENVVGNRRFVWKILEYSQCSRSCGGGIQLGKYRCVEEDGSEFEREISPVHCLGNAPAPKRRRCSNFPCPPRWRTATWSQCPECGPASKTRIVGCVQDHSRGITKVADHKCPAPKPPTVEICDIPLCEEIKKVEKKRTRPRDHIDAFHAGPVYTVALNRTNVKGSQTPMNRPTNTVSVAAAGWLHTEWSECVGWCVGGGVRTRRVHCTDPAGCAPHQVPNSSISCVPKLSCDSHEGQWFTGSWSHCSARCNGKQVRGVLCIGGTGRHVRESACKGSKPEHIRVCGEDCSPTWYLSEWGPCESNCTYGFGIQRRTVLCTKDGADNISEVADIAMCKGSQPPSQRSCPPSCQSEATIPPELTIESQKVANDDNIVQEMNTKSYKPKGCKDKLDNCILAVQARLCHYKYYIHNCCDSCNGR